MIINSVSGRKKKLGVRQLEIVHVNVSGNGGIGGKDDEDACFAIYHLFPEF